MFLFNLREIYLYKLLCIWQIEGCLSSFPVLFIELCSVKSQEVDIIAVVCTIPKHVTPIWLHLFRVWKQADNGGVSRADWSGSELARWAVRVGAVSRFTLGLGNRAWKQYFQVNGRCFLLEPDTMLTHSGFTLKLSVTAMVILNVLESHCKGHCDGKSGWFNDLKKKSLWLIQ